MKPSRVAKASAAKNLKLEDIGARLEVRRHPGARRLTLRVSRTRRAVVVTIPVQCDLDEAGSFLDRHIDWVRERLDSLPDPVPFADGVAMPVRGEAHDVVFAGGRGRRHVQIERGGMRPCLVISGDADLAPTTLKTWLFKEARRDLERSVAHYSAQIGRAPLCIAVRDQTSRWGSCSTTGSLSFSWRLVLAPHQVLAYVAAHEVAHLREMNHGPRFWALVRKLVPEFEAAKDWLRVRGPDLHRYGPAHASR